MLYKPGYGKFKDSLCLFHNGRFYLFAMFLKEGGDYNNIWLAESEDGVHWKDTGPVVEDFENGIIAMGIHKVGGKFILNHGSFDEKSNQNTIKFWESADLLHWTYRGKDADLTTLELDPSGKMRLDAMNVAEHRGKYYGYATGPRGFLASDDGFHWDFIPTRIDFDGMPKTPTLEMEGSFEVGGCAEINGTFYYLGGWFNYLGRKGYSVCTLRSGSPEGPFIADPAAYRLTGNSSRWVALWARFVLGSSEVLVNSYMQQGFSYECGDTWLPPLKKAEVDQSGHLRLMYWPGNDRLIGRERPLKNSEFTIQAREYNSLGYDPGEINFVLCPEQIDAENGVVITGFIEAASSDMRCTAPSAGILLEEAEGLGTFIWLHGYGLTEIGYGEFGGKYSFTVEDFVGPGCAAPAGLIPAKKHHFRILIRKNMYEFYLDDFHIDLFNTTHFPDKPGIAPRRIGFLIKNGTGKVTDLKINTMEI
ncbi:MAG: hypothetical protein LBQ88_07825 [Treponema sp.]|jgi:hypothetical protein|nr:hypothetical protein [Treponema sp.]